MSDSKLLKMGEMSENDFLKEVSAHVDQGYEVAAGFYDFETGKAWALVVRKQKPSRLPGTGQTRISETVKQDEM